MLKSAPSRMTGKWSAKTPEHNAARVRNNQRRHRTRVKERMSDLETRLAQTQRLLDAALTQIDELKSELAKSINGAVSTRDQQSLLAPRGQSPVIYNAGTQNDLASQDDQRRAPPSMCCNSLATSPITSAATTTCDEVGNCNDFEPQAQDESTTPCDMAFAIIKQQNFRDVDVAAIGEWLRRGYRRALRNDDGCRVENGLLFTVLDFISSS
ncbi:hypothetical protein NA57DRAFT_72659 [Rhizodiscina lignyota]|uniref:BZIP domain-containing protein n=1 Tax=Rhizodiscina lignyota TaxID=1504668 RepID=A0A9P4MBB4_9PEZI|nr:hypothetical protein NA57DRAFT_72659 [Rhizodiscina lignyota]